ILGAGSHTLSASFAALGDFGASSGSGTLTVNKAPLTVKTDSKSKTYGQPFSASAFTGTVTGQLNGDAITIASNASAGAAASATVAGSPYTISATLSDPANRLGNYTVINNYGTLTVNPAVLTVTATNASRVFGTPN